MRFVEIKITCYDKEEQKVVGEDNANGVNTRCCVDLYNVETFWEDPVTHELLIYMHNGVSYWTSTYTFDQFRDLYKNNSEEVVKKDMTDKEFCPDCNQPIKDDSCTVCGRIVVKNK